MSTSAVVAQALAALAGRIASAGATANWLRVAVSYDYPVMTSALTVRLPVTLLPGYVLSPPGAVADVALASALADALEGWIAANTPAPGQFVFQFTWWDDAMPGRHGFDYP